MLPLYKIAFILFNNLTLLDFVGIYDPISRINKAQRDLLVEWDLCALDASVMDGFGLEMRVDLVKPDLSKYDLVIVPGGFGTRNLRYHEDMISWLKTAGSANTKASVCTGSLLLGAAGYLENKRATTNASAYDLLEPYCGELVKERIVEDGKIITAGGVAASLDLGLYICEKFIGAEATKKIRTQMNYRG